MSAPMKKRPIKQVEIRLIGPKKNLKPLLSLVKDYDFEPKTSSDNNSVPWETLAKDRIQKFTAPGLALRGARLRQSLTQVELAKKIEIPQYNISKMEKGARPIGKKMAKRLAVALNVDYRVFL